MSIRGSLVGTAAVIGLTVLNGGTRPARAQQPTDYSPPAGAPYRAESVTVPTPMGHTLAGTLTLPEGASKIRPVAAIVTISGTGPQDRDEYLGLVGYRPFRQIADSLGRLSIAVLRMDDRGVGQSKGTFKGTTHFEFVEDIRAGLAYLRTRPEIDAKRLGLLGHSEGALDAALVAEKEPAIRALVLLAGQARPLRMRAEYQLASLIRLDTTRTPAQREAALARVSATLDSIIAADRYMATIIAYDPRATARKVKNPAILILTGSTDGQADAAQVPEWVAAFKESGNRDVTGRILPDLNHLFVYDLDGAAANYAKLPQPVSMDPKVVGMIADWLVNRLR